MNWEWIIVCIIYLRAQARYYRSVHMKHVVALVPLSKCNPAPQILDQHLIWWPNNGIFHLMWEHLKLHQSLLWLVVATSNQLKPVQSSLVCMMKNSITLGSVSLQIQNSNNADVL